MHVALHGVGTKAAILELVCTEGTKVKLWCCVQVGGVSEHSGHSRKMLWSLGGVVHHYLNVVPRYLWVVLLVCGLALHVCVWLCSFLLLHIVPLFHGHPVSL